MRRILGSVLMTLALIGGTMGAAVAASPTYTGLWSSTFTAGQTVGECANFALDANTFCFADGNGGAPVALGVKFMTSAPVMIQGVRVYRVDAGAVSGTLWNIDGTQLATGSFAPYAGSHGWQDLIFSQPVAMLPGQTYVASYWVPTAYAFAYNYFGSPVTVGPITAVGSATNGTYCFSATDCFPNSSIGANYWVTPLWISYDFAGFYQPVDNDGWNTAKAGSAIPVKFSLGGDQGLDIFMAGYPKAIPTACPGGADPVDPIEETVTAGGSSLTYDAATDQYVYVWKTSKAWATKCFTFELGLIDGSSHSFDVQFKK